MMGVQTSSCYQSLPARTGSHSQIGYCQSIWIIGISLMGMCARGPYWLGINIHQDEAFLLAYGVLQRKLPNRSLMNGHVPSTASARSVDKQGR